MLNISRPARVGVRLIVRHLRKMQRPQFLDHRCPITCCTQLNVIDGGREEGSTTDLLNCLKFNIVHFVKSAFIFFKCSISLIK